jgi:transcriptional regulator with XRE-family HTH domain
MLTEFIKLRKQLGLNQTQIAKVLNLSLGHYQRIERQDLYFLGRKKRKRPYTIDLNQADDLYHYLTAKTKKQGLDIDININKLFCENKK